MKGKTSMMKTKRFISLTLVLVTLLSVMSAFSLSASAIGTGKLHLHEAKSTVRFTVTANKNTSIKFVCKEGGQGVAPTLLLTVYDRTSNQTHYYWVTGNGRSLSSRLDLTKNHTYNITVSYNYSASRNWVKTNFYDSNFRRVYAWADGKWYIENNNNCTFW
jgi:hypothetical protein